MHNDLRETWVYQEILHEGRQEGQEMERRTELDQQRLMLTTFVQEYYPEIADLARKKANSISDLKTLERIFMQVLRTHTQEGIAAILA